MIKKKITIFSASLLNNNHLEEPLIKTCVNSFIRLKNYILSKGYDCEIKIYDWDDPVVNNFYELLKKHNIPYEKSGPEFFSDIFRIWLMSENKNYLWLDTDVYIRDDADFSSLDFNNKVFEGYNWFMYNAEDLDFFKNILNYYLEKRVEVFDNDTQKLKFDNAVYENIFKTKIDNSVVTDRKKWCFHTVFIDMFYKFNIKWHKNPPDGSIIQVNEEAFKTNKFVCFTKIKNNKTSNRSYNLSNCPELYELAVKLWKDCF